MWVGEAWLGGEWRMLEMVWAWRSRMESEEVVGVTGWLACCVEDLC